MNLQQNYRRRLNALIFPLLDYEFDCFEWDADLESILHEAEVGTHYHASLHLQE